MITKIFISLIGALVLTTSTAQINGSGATLPRLLYEEMFRHYELLTEIPIDYRAIGSGKGIQEFLAQKVDFVASDLPLTNVQLVQATASEASKAPNVILHIPIAISAVVPAYNFAPFYEVDKLILNGEILAKIFLGEIRFWDDDAIVTLNPDVQLPNLPILVIYRNDVSGTTSIFIDYLSKVSEHWSEEVGQGPLGKISWPIGFGENSNAGAAKMIRQTPGAIGYIALSEAKQANLKIVNLYNAAGNVVSATTEAAMLSANVDVSDDLRVSITNTDHEQGWPIAGLTWILLYKDQNYSERSIYQATQIKNLVSWMLTDGQNLNKSLDYAPLTEEIQNKAQLLLNDVYYTTFE